MILGEASYRTVLRASKQRVIEMHFRARWRQRPPLYT